MNQFRFIRFFAAIFLATKGIRGNGSKKMNSISSTKKTWDGHERRKIKRRAEDLRQCKLCSVFFFWESCDPTCIECAHKLIILYTSKGKIVDIVA